MDPQTTDKQVIHSHSWQKQRIFRS